MQTANTVLFILIIIMTVIMGICFKKRQRGHAFRAVSAGVGMWSFLFVSLFVAGFEGVMEEIILSLKVAGLIYSICTLLIILSAVFSAGKAPFAWFAADAVLLIAAAVTAALISAGDAASAAMVVPMSAVFVVYAALFVANIRMGTSSRAQKVILSVIDAVYAVTVLLLLAMIWSVGRQAVAGQSPTLISLIILLALGAIIVYPGAACIGSLISGQIALSKKKN